MDSEEVEKINKKSKRITVYHYISTMKEQHNTLNQQMDLEQYIAELVKNTPRCITCGQKVNPFFEKPFCSEDCEQSEND